MFPCTPLPRSAVLLPIEHPRLLSCGSGEHPPRTQHTCIGSTIFWTNSFSFPLPFTSEENSEKECTEEGGWCILGSVEVHSHPVNDRGGVESVRMRRSIALFPPSPLRWGRGSDVMRTSAVASRFLIANTPTHRYSFFPVPENPAPVLPVCENSDGARRFFSLPCRDFPPFFFPFF